MLKKIIPRALVIPIHVLKHILGLFYWTFVSFVPWSYCLIFFKIKSIFQILSIFCQNLCPIFWLLFQVFESNPYWDHNCLALNFLPVQYAFYILIGSWSDFGIHVVHLVFYTKYYIMYPNIALKVLQVNKCWIKLLPELVLFP